MKRLKLSNRLNYTILAVIIIIALGIGVYAYGTNNPSNFGHSAGEIDGVVSQVEYVQQNDACNGLIVAECPSGKEPIGGGCFANPSDADSIQIVGSNPSWFGDNIGWECFFVDTVLGGSTDETCQSYAVCAVTD